MIDVVASILIVMWIIGFILFLVCLFFWWKSRKDLLEIAKKRQELLVREMMELKKTRAK